MLFCAAFGARCPRLGASSSSRRIDTAPPLDPVSFDLRQALDQSLTPSPPRRGARIVLGAILLVHLALAVWLGWPEPGPSRWWDERFNVLNVESILRAGRIELANGYYGGVSYLPQTAALAVGEALHRATDGRTPPMVTKAGHLTAAGYHLIRISQALWGTATLALLFLLARRLAREEIAVLAVGLVAITPRLYQASAIFKPDVELAAATLLALLLGWRAAAGSPRLGAYLLAGLAVGLAVGAKLNGVAAAGPLVVATGLRFRERLRWLYLVAAGAASFLAFWLFNPDLPRVLRSLEKNQEHYERTGSGALSEVLSATLSYPFRENFHGPWVAAIGILGALAVLGWVLADRAPEARDRRLAWTMVLSYPPIYYALYVVASPRAKANHFLQIVPFVALFAAVALGALGLHLFSREGMTRRLLASLALALLVVPPARGVVGWIHSQAVPSTWDQAEEWVEDRLPEPSRAFRIATIDRDRRGRFPRSPVYERLEPPYGDLSSYDGLLVPRSRTEELLELAGIGDWLAGAIERRDFPASLLTARDRSLVAVLRPATLRDHEAAGRIRFHRDATGRLVTTLPESTSGERLSIRIRLSVGDRWAPKLRLLVGGERLRLALGPASGGDIFLTSPRFDAPGDRRLTVTLDGKELQTEAKAELFVWRSP